VLLDDDGLGKIGVGDEGERPVKVNEIGCPFIAGRLRPEDLEIFEFEENEDGEVHEEGSPDYQKPAFPGPGVTVEGPLSTGCFS
jgi:hypothetical protein